MPSPALRESARDGAVAREHEQIEQRVAVLAPPTAIATARAVRRGQRSGAKAAAAQVEEHVHGARVVEERRVGDALAVEVGPGEAARPRDAGETDRAA